MPATAVVIKRAAARARRENTGMVTVLIMKKPLAGSEAPPDIVQTAAGLKDLAGRIVALGFQQLSRELVASWYSDMGVIRPTNGRRPEYQDRSP